MVPYHHNWDAFSKAVVALYQESPVKVGLPFPYFPSSTGSSVRGTDEVLRPMEARRRLARHPGHRRQKGASPTPVMLVELARLDMHPLGPDAQVVKFKARSAIFLNRFDALTRTLMTKMQAAPVVNPAFVVPAPAPAPASVPAPTSAPAGSQAAPSKAAAEPAKNAGGGAAAAGGKKKKGKKKK